MASSGKPWETCCPNCGSAPSAPETDAEIIAAMTLSRQTDDVVAAMELARALVDGIPFPGLLCFGG